MWSNVVTQLSTILSGRSHVLLLQTRLRQSWCWQQNEVRTADMKFRWHGKACQDFFWEFPGWWSKPFKIRVFFFAIVLCFIFAVSFRSLRILCISCVLKQKAIWLEGHMNLNAPLVWRTWNSGFFTAIWRSWKSGFVLTLRKHVKKTETTLIRE